MARYILRRFLISIPVLVGVALILFLLLNVVPGDPVTLMMGEHIKPALIEAFRARMHLDDPVLVRFGRYMLGALRGDFGVSYKLQREVSGLIWQAFPHTVKLTIYSAFVSWIIGIPAGIFSAVKHNTLIDRSLMGFSLMGVSLPIFWAGLLMQYVFASRLGWLPVTGYYSIKYYIMPSVVLGWSSAGTVARLTRSNLLEIMKNDFIRTARAKGLSEPSVVACHALKNAMLPVITVMALQVAGLLGGAVMTESVFGIPGIGRIAVDAITHRDMPLLQGTILFTTAIVIAGNLAADIMYAFLDPRIRVEQANS
ncbi:MAG: ABC transporter permease [Synergistaceae bacterium]|jgi:peptide/nickel transport system permease protein|nr:ABC transporter permease [Synergistaceae bacterium]